MANGGIQKALSDLGATVRLQEAALTVDENTEYGGWKRLGMALGHFSDLVAANERDGYFTVGLLTTCPSMPGLVAEIDRAQIIRGKYDLDVVGHYARPDIFQLHVDERAKQPVTTQSGEAAPTFEEPQPDRYVAAERVAGG